MLVSALVALLYVIIYFLFAGALYGLFRKAGIKYPWFAFIPMCSTIGQLWVIGKSGWNVLWQLVPIANVVFAIIWGVKFLRAYGKSGWWMLWAMLPISDIVFSIMFLVWGYGSETQYRGVPQKFREDTWGASKTDGGADNRRQSTKQRIAKVLSEINQDSDFFDNNDF